jgi:hypothetical protein
VNTISDRIRDLDIWHGELLDRLVLLDKQVNEVLQEWTAVKEELPEKLSDSLA